jgi:hypothetical protein
MTEVRTLIVAGKWSMHTCSTQQNYFVAIRLEGVTSVRGECCVRKGRSESPGYVN